MSPVEASLPQKDYAAQSDVQRFHRENRGKLFCVGFQPWKHEYIRRFLHAPGNQVQFPNSARSAARLGLDAQSHIIVWGQREASWVTAAAQRHGIRLWRMEDGFIRSVGLGTHFVEPASLVLDRRGIYYDPRQPSDLEVLLAETEFTPEDLERAKALRRTLIDSGLNKYNVGTPVTLPDAKGKTVLLVPGQVADDASVALGCPGINTNLGLLRAARAAHPNAFIIYKPHPDVLTSARAGDIAQSELHAVCDHVEERATLADCLRACDEVHTLTSLVGMEALLRGVKVVVYGQPFYAGWGLTEDIAPIARRQRVLSIDELFCGTYLLYPRYMDRQSGLFTTAEAVVAELLSEREAKLASGAPETLRGSWIRLKLARLSHLLHWWRGRKTRSQHRNSARS